PIAIIVGTDEYNKGVVQLKDLALGSKISKDATLEEWKSQPAQKEVKRESLVGEVLAMLEKTKNT
ncbi:MAG: histidine--tRNA ligase, partial [Paracoccaceae bacterium]